MLWASCWRGRGGRPTARLRVSRSWRTTSGRFLWSGIALEHLRNAIFNVARELIHAGFGVANQLFAHFCAGTHRYRDTHFNAMCAASSRELRCVAQPDVWLPICSRWFILVVHSSHLPLFVSVPVSTLYRV